MERFTLYWIESDVTIEAGAVLAVGSGAHIYGGVDWVAMAMSADETADLTKPEVSYARLQILLSVSSMFCDYGGVDWVVMVMSAKVRERGRQPDQARGASNPPDFLSVASVIRLSEAWRQHPAGPRMLEIRQPAICGEYEAPCVPTGPPTVRHALDDTVRNLSAAAHKVTDADRAAWLDAGAGCGCAAPRRQPCNRAP